MVNSIIRVYIASRVCVQGELSTVQSQGLEEGALNRE